MVSSSDEVVLNKVAIIKHGLKHVRADYLPDEQEFEANMLRQDAVILNLQRACEASIDLTMHWIRRAELGVPQGSRQAFAMLTEVSILDSEISTRMQAMVGFRNVAVHDYQGLNLNIVRAIVDYRFNDCSTFARAAIRGLEPNGA